MVEKKQQTLILPVMVGLALLAACSKQQMPTHHKQEQKNHDLCTRIENTYTPMIKLAQAIDYQQNRQEFTKQIMIYNDRHNKKRNKSLFSTQHKDLPFVQYKSLLDKEVRRLERSLRKLRRKKVQDKKQENEIRTLIAQLEQLNQVLITSKEYHKEKLKLAEQKSGLWGMLNFGLGSLVRKFIPV